MLLGCTPYSTPCLGSEVSCSNPYCKVSYVLMFGVFTFTQDGPSLQDAVYIDLAGSHAHAEEAPSKMVTSLMETQYPLDAKIRQASVTLLQVCECVCVYVM